MYPLFKPKQYVAALHEVSAPTLFEQGIRGVLLDLDNTLVAWRGSELAPQMEEWVKDALKAGLKICIVSNTWRRARIEAIAEKLGVPFILRAGKPRRGSLTRGMQTLGVRAAETAVIGDQIFTDVIGGNRIGAYTILCIPMPGREFVGTNIVRAFERFLMKRLAAQGHLSLPALPAPGHHKGIPPTESTAKTPAVDAPLTPRMEQAVERAVDRSLADMPEAPAAE